MKLPKFLITCLSLTGIAQANLTLVDFGNPQGEEGEYSLPYNYVSSYDSETTNYQLKDSAGNDTYTLTIQRDRTNSANQVNKYTWDEATYDFYAYMRKLGVEGDLDSSVWRSGMAFMPVWDDNGYQPTTFSIGGLTANTAYTVSFSLSQVPIPTFYMVSFGLGISFGGDVQVINGSWFGPWSGDVIDPSSEEPFMLNYEPTIFTYTIMVGADNEAGAFDLILDSANSSIIQYLAITPTNIPEPSAAMSMLFGGISLMAVRRRKRS